MELNLTIDQGNSSAKIVLWSGQEAVEKITVSRLTREVLEEVVERHHPAGALVCSVTGNGPRMARWLGERGVKAREVTADMPLPITIGYATPQTLGEDRVAAAAGAWSLFPGEMSLVVDMGTAVTYDVVSERGEYLGGNIAPGVGMRLRALRSFTARLPEVGGYGETPVFGTDTVTAMRAGAIRGVVSEIAYYRSRLPEGARVVLTGGWAERVSQFLDFPVTVDSCLVTKGLLSILHYNEDKTHQ
ncbi:type III pantothenate kinase [uncultured Duncaniella sp.]|uniref:type III pantothenate kinase n=1 Tax=uncultured Duncaniella sp. TaxID=2768039 RepID=UPI0026488092|nr:type III pantothenate kinase [uncultured Duncaniella sp.]